MALAVYAVVMLLVSRVVASLESARSEAQSRTAEARRLFELSELLVEDRSVEDLLRTIVGAVRTVFEVPGVALLVPQGDRLEVAASAGEALSRDELHGLRARVRSARSASAPGPADPGELRTVALTASGRPVGMLAMRGRPASEADRALLRTFANHAALALERAQLRDQALRSELLEEVDRLAARAGRGGVARPAHPPGHHEGGVLDLAASRASRSPTHDIDELHGLIDVETDRLTRLVTSLLDMTRIDAGVLEVRRRTHRRFSTLAPRGGRRPPRRRWATVRSCVRRTRRLARGRRRPVF